jgi:hypothetical protein
MGVGIAMSGNANGVDQALKIGGENHDIPSLISQRRI